MIKLAFACGYHGEFGYKDSFPWGSPYKQDMDEFKNFTANCILVMGRKTFESLPSKLRLLKHVVLSTKQKHEIKCKNSENPDIVLSGNSVDLVKGLASVCGVPVCVIGGAELIEEFAAYPEIVDQVLCTKITIDSIHPDDTLEHDVRIDKDFIYDNLLEDFNFCRTLNYKLGYETTLDISVFKNV